MKLNSKLLLINNFLILLTGFQLVTWEFPYYESDIAIYVYRGVDLQKTYITL